MRDWMGRELRPSGHLVVGIVFIVAGIIFLLARLDLFAGLHLFSQTWPLIVLFLGVVKLIFSAGNTGRLFGVFWICVGGLFFASNAGYLHYNPWNLLWPIAMVWVGLSIVWRSNERRRIEVDSRSVINPMTFFGGIHRKVNAVPFKGGEVTAVAGGCSLDLRDSVMEENEAVIRVLICMGGLELMIPQGWTVESRIVPVMAGIDDRSTQPQVSTKRLIIDGFLFMGGIDIKN